MRSAAQFAAAALTLLTAWGCSGSESDPRTRARLVETLQVRAQSSVTNEYVGVVRARVESDLGFRVGGKISARLVNTGDAVRAGQPLMRLDANDLILSEAAQQSAVAAARAQSVRADADFARMQTLFAQGASSAQAFDLARATTSSAKATLSSAQAQLRVAENARSYAVLVADADGVIEDTLAEPGQVVTAGQTVIHLAHAGAREASVNLPENVRPAIQAPALARLYARNDPPSRASLRQLSQAADPATRTYEARFVLSGAAASAALGSTVAIRLQSSSATGGRVSVPLAAIYDPGNGPGVWGVTTGATVNFLPVRIVSLGDETATVTGLTEGQTVVALGAYELVQGQKVRTTTAIAQLSSK